MINRHPTCTSQRPLSIILPTCSTDSNSNRPILEQFDYFGIADVVVRLSRLVGDSNDIISATNCTIGSSKRVIPILRLIRKTSLQCLVNRVLQVAPITCTFRRAFQKVLFSQVHFIETILEGSALPYQRRLTHRNSCKRPASSTSALRLYRGDRVIFAPIKGRRRANSGADLVCK